ncbi:SagB-type dehydrogenase domain protein [uncultured Desulfobacterium sp.]|uniref:SagB-type dehydrogenase domain protein n=1 Tax=uncultured Desulfobacterium sp. TaxID=201089 RepID=A0A445N032_9BACT|nr:SagB-type dehydrogenase domain protein [uncultured Desulfobacterium sp.]
MTSAWDYHNRTSYDRRDMKGGYLDWSSQPGVFKSYPGRSPAPLPRDTLLTTESVQSILAVGNCESDASPINLNRLGKILYLTHTLTAKARVSGGDFYYRSVASAGALYPFELYVAALTVADLKAGIYHHDILNNGLTLLRNGISATELIQGLGFSRDNLPAVVFFLTAIIFRSSWKYRDRAYRYLLLDTGHMAENLSLALRSERLRFRVFYDFEDQAVNDLLAIDSNREVCLAAVCVWAGDGVLKDGPGLEPSQPDLSAYSKVSDGERDYPIIREIHAASSYVPKNNNQRPPFRSQFGLAVDSWKELPDTLEPPDILSYPEAVQKRRSMRNYISREMPEQRFSALLRGVCSDIHLTVIMESSIPDCIGIGLLIGNIVGWTPGFYLLDRTRRAIGLVREGFMMDEMAHVCLDQAWLANCSVHIVFLADFNEMEETGGARFYRHAMMNAGRLGQRIYLLATSMRIGCCGIGAFYDAEAAMLLGLTGRNRMLYLVGAGVVKKWAIWNDRL